MRLRDGSRSPIVTPMLVCGVDENGMGPRLGPLVATAVTLRLASYDRGKLRRRGLKHGVGDSKQTSAFGQMRHAESLALALAERALGAIPESADDVLRGLGLETPAALRAPCPDATHVSQCWGALALPAFGGTLDEGRATLRGLEGRTLEVMHVRTHAICAGRLNAAFAEGKTKLDVDLATFEWLLMDAREAAGEDLLAHCGIIGGLRRYVPRFSRFGVAPPGEFRLAEPVRVLEEVKGRSRYAVPDLGEVSFEVKADDRHLAVWARLDGGEVRPRAGDGPPRRLLSRRRPSAARGERIPRPRDGTFRRRRCLAPPEARPGRRLFHPRALSARRP